MTDLADLADLAGVFAEGYTPEDVCASSTAFAALTGYSLVAVWSDVDAWGTGSDSLLYLRDTAGQLYDLPDVVWDFLSGQGIPPQALAPSLASLAAPAHADDGITPLDLDALIRVDTCNYAYGLGEDERTRMGIHRA
jgi:hypothetical protein